jgi:zinc protease
MTLRLLWLMALATAASACLSMRSPPRFGSLRPDTQPLQFRHDVRLYTVENGIIVALLPDKRTNLVTVDARYLVGGADDPTGRAGLAHLVEHLTFEARTEGGPATLGDRLGEAALQYNAFTSHDVTHYTATALAHRLSDVLELEAQRLELSCEQLDEAVFQRERGVVLEEVAERRTPWSDVHLEIQRAVWGERHPYARRVGTLEVADATREEACRFIASHYAPDRLMLIVTGDFDPDKVAREIGKRFARASWRSDTAQARVQNAKLTGTRSRHRADLEEAVAVVLFPAPAWGGEDVVLHQLAQRQLSRVMAGADSEHDWITNVGVIIEGSGRAQLLSVVVSVDDPKRLDAAVDEVFSRASSMFDEVSPYAAASLLGRLQTDYVTSYESFATRGPWLLDFLTYTRHEDFMMPELGALANATLADAASYARARFVRERSHVALVEPSGKPATAARAEAASDRSPDLAPWRVPVDVTEAQRPLPVPARRDRDTLEELTLDNGLRVLLAPEPTSALVDARLVFPHGAASDPTERRGRATAAATLLEPHPDRMYSPGDVYLLGWGMSVGTQLDQRIHETSTVFSARGASNLADWHVWRLMWLIDQCGYMSGSVKTFRDVVVRASASDVDPAEVLTRQRLFGAGHPYATPPPAGEAWSWLTSDELERYRRTYYVPRGATLIITGGFDVEKMRQHVRDLFSPWPDVAAAPPATLPAAQPAPGPSWVGTRDASRTQVGLELAFATGSDPDRDQAARLVLTEMVRDRLRVVREGMGASYGVHVAYSGGVGGSAFFVESDLEPSRAAKAVTAIMSEFAALRTGAGAMAEDFVRARRRVLASTLADTAGVTARADRLEYGVRRGLASNYSHQLALAVSKVTPAEVAAVAAVDLDPRRMVGQVAATSEQLDAVLKTLGATEPTVFDKKHRSEKKH